MLLSWCMQSQWRRKSRTLLYALHVSTNYLNASVHICLPWVLTFQQRWCTWKGSLHDRKCHYSTQAYHPVCSTSYLLPVIHGLTMFTAQRITMSTISSFVKSMVSRERQQCLTDGVKMSHSKSSLGDGYNIWCDTKIRRQSSISNFTVAKVSPPSFTKAGLAEYLTEFIIDYNLVCLFWWTISQSNIYTPVISGRWLALSPPVYDIPASEDGSVWNTMTDHDIW